MKKVISLLLALIMVLSLVACGGKTDDGGKDPSGDPVIQDRLVIANGNMLSILDPQNNNDLWCGHTYSMTHDKLVEFDYQNNKLVPELATEWSFDADSLTYTFKLRDDVTFHNGEKFTAQDVIYTYERGMGFSFQQTRLKYIDKMEADGDYTLKITLNSPAAEFLEGLASPNLGILNKKAIEADAEKGGMVGTGPFVFKFENFKPDESVVLTRNDSYWGEAPKSKEIEYRKIAEAGARVIGLQTGEIDICLEVPAVEAPNIADYEGVELIQQPSSKLLYMAMNMGEKGPDFFKDERVRKALNYATNTEDIIIAMTEGYASPAQGCIAPTMFGHDPNVATYEYDLEKAKALLKEAGYDENNKLQIGLIYKAGVMAGFYEILQAQWALANVDLVLKSEDSTTTVELLAGKAYHIYQTQWNWSTTCAGLDNLWNSTAGNNRSLTNDPELDKMLADVCSEMDNDKRAEKIGKIGDYLSAYGAMIPLYIDTLLTGVGSNVDGLVLNFNQVHEFAYAYVTE